MTMESKLEDENQVLESCSAFKIGEKRLLVISVIPDEMIVVKPKNIDEMGVIAHLLGNLHKPVESKTARFRFCWTKSS